MARDTDPAFSPAALNRISEFRAADVSQQDLVVAFLHYGETLIRVVFEDRFESAQGKAGAGQEGEAWGWCHGCRHGHAEGAVFFRREVGEAGGCDRAVGDAARWEVGGDCFGCANDDLEDSISALNCKEI